MAQPLRELAILPEDLAPTWQLTPDLIRISSASEKKDFKGKFSKSIAQIILGTYCTLA